MQKTEMNEDTLTKSTERDSEVIDQYEIGPYRITIHKNAIRYTNEFLYSCNTIAETSPFGEIIESICKNLSANASPNAVDTTFPLDSKFYPLQDLFKDRKVLVEKYVQQQYPEFLDMENFDDLVELACYRLIGIHKIAPFLLDELIEEFYLDCPHTHIYLDHRKWGRCVTTVILSENDLDRIKTRLRYESGLLLDESNPSIKTELITDRFHVRTSLDIFPLAADGLHLDVRKLKRKAFTLPELIDNESLTAEISAYLYFMLLRRRNITVIGEPNSGKTTLVNALDLLTPPAWRKITIEDVIESVPQHHYDKHQVRFQVIPFEGKRTLRSKSKEIVKLLHRSPDYVFLGEIQTQEHSQAVFHALTAGLHLIQTCHASSPENLIVRWVEHHGIAPINLLSLDIIVFMRTYYQERLFRKVRRVSEVETPYLSQEDRHQLDLAIKQITLTDTFNVDNQHTKTVTELFDTPTMRSIRTIEGLDLDEFIEELTCYLKIFNYLAKQHIFDPEINVRIFHELQAEKSRHQGDRGQINWPALYNHVMKLVNHI